MRRKRLVIAIAVIITAISLSGCAFEKDSNAFEKYIGFIGEDSSALGEGYESTDDGESIILSSFEKVSFDKSEGIQTYTASKDGKIYEFMWTGSPGEDKNFDVYERSDKLLKKLVKCYGDYDSKEGDRNVKEVFAWNDIGNMKLELIVYGVDDLSYYVVKWTA